MFKSAYMSSNVNCFSDINLISWFYDWYLSNAFAFNSSRKKCFQLSYLSSMFFDVDDCSDIFWIRFFDLLDLSKSENAWIFSFFLIFYFIRLLTVTVEMIFFKINFFCRTQWLIYCHLFFIHHRSLSMRKLEIHHAIASFKCKYFSFSIFI